MTQHFLSSQKRRKIERILLTIIKQELKDCVKVVRQYVPLKKYPDINIVHVNKNPKIAGIYLPDWVRALTIRQNIYILENGKHWSFSLLKKILYHELFHAGVYLYFGDEKLVPYWFNEAIAHSLGKKGFGFKTTVSEDNILGHYDFEENEKLPTNLNDKNLFPFIAHASIYISKNYKPQAIRSTLQLAKKIGDFEQAMRKILHLEISELMRNKEIIQKAD